jgi:hypothetical protein
MSAADDSGLTGIEAFVPEVGRARVAEDRWPGPGALPDITAGQAGRRAALVEKAAGDWKNALVDLGGRNNLLHYRDLKLGTLDLTAADPGVVSGFLLG